MKIIDLTAQSKNYTKGREGRKVKFLAIHWIGAGTGESAAKYLLNNANNTSAHYIVEDDKVWLVVHPENTAHAVGNWIKNTESISIEHSATPDRPASEQTYKTSADLIKDLCSIYGLKINTDTIKPHSFFSSTQCPGTVSIPKLIKLATGGTTESDKDKKIVELEKEKDKFETLSKEQAKTIDIMVLGAKDLHEKTIGLSNQIQSKNITIEEQAKKIEDQDTAIEVLNTTLVGKTTHIEELDQSIEDAIKKANDWEADYIELETQLTKTNNLYNKQVGDIERMTAEISILQTANRTTYENSINDLDKFTTGYLLGEISTRVIHKLSTLFKERKKGVK